METRKILIADDENGIVQIISTKLRNNGFEVFTADNGTDALKLCFENKPDVVIVDYELPKVDGIALAEKIHQKKGFADTAIILLAVKENEITQKQMVGINERLDKPFSPKELLSRVENILTVTTGK